MSFFRLVSYHVLWFMCVVVVGVFYPQPSYILQAPLASMAYGVDATRVTATASITAPADVVAGSRKVAKKDSALHSMVVKLPDEKRIVKKAKPTIRKVRTVQKKVVAKQPVKPVIKEKGAAYWKKVIYSWPGASKKEKKWLVRVGMCESGLREGAYNRSSGASGMFQYILKWHPQMRGKVWDGRENIRYALQKYRAGGANLWECN